MVTTQGFNALLKLVEEPPPHLRFIFATTEPDKVIPTIRSRTHHYPFRLIPPRLLSSYLSDLCEKEGVAIEPAALPLLVRAGAGSARDTLSVLDQLLGGAGPEGVTHSLASGLLGYTPDSLLDEVVDAFAAGDGAAVFGVVDKVIETGQDPRRFTEDLLRRLRDLVIVAAVPDAPATGLIDVSQDQGERLVAQAARFGKAELSRAADLVATGLTEMRGATAPRLLLELICARVLLPGADHTTLGVQARLDRLEKRAAISGTPSAEARPEPTPAAPTPTPTPTPAPQPQRPTAPEAEAAPEPERPVAEPAPTAEPEPAPAAPAGAQLSLVDVRRLWPDIVDATKQRRRVTWIHLTQNAQVVAVDATTLTLGFANVGARESFEAGGSAEIVRQAAIDVVGADWKIETIVDPAADASAAPPPAAPEPEPAPAPPAEPATAPASNAAREAVRETRSVDTAPEPDQHLADADADAHPDDVDADSDEAGGTDLLQRELGAQMIEEIPHS
jgi:DNA polymerase-3 subunit gamma/tau